MPSLAHSVSVFLSLSPTVVCASDGAFVETSVTPVFSTTEKETRLPCQYQPSGNVVVVQVIWTKDKPDGTKEQIITAHHMEGQLGKIYYIHPKLLTAVRSV